MEKPEIYFNSKGESGNVFELITAVVAALRQAGQNKLANTVFSAVDKRAKSYDEAIRVLGEFAELIDIS